MSEPDLFDQTLFDIDLDQLELHWMDHPKLVRRATDHRAQLILEIGEKKAEIKVAEAELKYAVRINPEDYDIDKATDKAVESIVESNEALIEQYKELRSLEHQKDNIQSVIDSLYDKKTALENLVKLHGQNYFSVPYVAGPSGKKIKRSAEKASRKTTRKKR